MGKDGLMLVVTLEKAGKLIKKNPIDTLIPLPPEQRGEESGKDTSNQTIEPNRIKEGTTPRKIWKTILLTLMFISFMKQAKGESYYVQYANLEMYIEHIE